MFYFSRQQLLLFSAIFILITIFPGLSFGYGYKKEEDPLITIFKSVVFHGRENDWTKVESGITTIQDRINDVQDLFGVNLRTKLDTGLEEHDFQEVIKVMANLVFLAIREKFYWNLAEELKMFNRAKVRLRLVEEYYTALLAGNVRRYDRINGTKMHEKIINTFAEARKALGSLGFLGAGAVAPRADEFRRIVNEIEQKLITVFPYFESGKEISYP